MDSVVTNNKKIFSVFLREKPSMMLVDLKNAKSQVYASALAKKIDCTYSHVVKILQEIGFYLNAKVQDMMSGIKATHQRN